MNSLHRIKKHSIITSILFVLFMLVSMLFNLSNITKKQKQIVLEHAKNAFEKDLVFRKWVSMHGGVYVTPTEETPPNIHLSHIKDRDVETTMGKKLTLMNPAYTLRQLMTNFPGLYGETGHITSLKLLNKDNKADSWETKVLQDFDKKIYDEYHEIYEYKNQQQLRYMKALHTEKSCLKCHAHQDYKVGDVRGGITISIPMKTYNEQGWIEKKYIMVLHMAIILVGLLIGFIIYKRITTSMLNEIAFDEKMKIKEDLLIQHSKMAAMGEMIENITHQWRQPLSVIAAISAGMQVKSELNGLTKDFIDDSAVGINDSVQHLSQTITDFRNFFDTNKKKEKCFIQQTFDKTLKLLESQFTTSNIQIIKNIQDITIVGLENEFIQVFINILNNARDELIHKTDQKRLIFIDVIQNKNNIEIAIKDNAGGIPKEIIHKVLDSHFTTKEGSHGTGIGLYMSKIIIAEHMDGVLEVSNLEYDYKNKTYFGAQFKIILPIP